MLTYPDTEIVGYADEDESEVECVPCATAARNAVLIEKARLGLDRSLRPMSRYTIEDGDQERGYAEAQERLARFRIEHPLIAAAADLDVLLLPLARRLNYESCVTCGRRLAQPLKRRR